jgi:ABC-type glycerol-3-phosphate transport system substrate-binding protein
MKFSTRQLIEKCEQLGIGVAGGGRAPLSRRDLITQGARAAALLGVGGAAFLQAAPQEAFAQEASGRPGDIVLTYLHISGPELPFDRVLAAEYLKQHPEIKDIVFDVFSYDEGFQKQSLALSRGDKTLDLLTIDEPWVPSHANAGFLHNVTEAFDGIADPAYDWNDFHPAGIAAAQWKNETFGIPLFANTLGLIYRKDLYQQAGLAAPTPGSTWHDFEAALKVLNRPALQQFGFASVHQRGALNVTDWMTYANSWLPYPGNQLYDESTWQPRFTEAFCTESLDFYISLMERYAMPGSLGVGWDQFVTGYQQGRIAHLIFWSTWWGLMEDPAASKVIGKNGWSTPYAGEHGFAASHRGFWVLGINRASAHPEAAYRFAEFMTSRQTMRRCALRGELFGRKSLYADAEINAKFPFYGQQQQNLDAIYKQHAYRPRLPQFAQLNEVMVANLAAASAREITPRQASERMASQSEVLLKRWGYLRT